MTVLDALAAPLLVAVVLGMVLTLPLPGLEPVERMLGSRWVPLVCGAAVAGAMWYEWGSLQHVPLLQDEAAYLLQAHLFATGRWADPGPALPAFFEQPHVLVTPTLASKYPPGNSLLLTPGIWLHAPGLVPVILLGLTGGLILAVGRQVMGRRNGPWPGLLAAVGWVGLVGHEAWPRPSYMSEIVTSTLWVLGWWSLLRWRERRDFKYLLLLAACVGWGAITRPLTMLVYVVPVAPIVLLYVVRRRQWRQLAVAVVLGGGVLALIPLWSARTTGDWRTSPLALYTAQYVPWDAPGFGIRDGPPTRALPPEIGCFEQLFGETHRYYTVSGLPSALLGRVKWFLSDTFNGWRLGLILFLAVGLAAMSLEISVAVVASAGLFIGYLWYSHDSRYTIYYMEAQPVVALLVGLGLWEAARALGARWGRRLPGEVPADAGRRIAGWCAIILVLAAYRPTREALQAVQHGHEIGDLPHRMFLSAVDSLPGPRSVVFVHYPSGEGCGQNLIENYPPLSAARAWIVYDRGEENAALLRLAPDRTPYRFDTKAWRMHSYYDSLRTAAGGPIVPATVQ